MDIQDIKQQLLENNGQLLKLFCAQLELTAQAAKLDKNADKQLFDRKSEEQVLENAVANSPQDMQNYSLEFFRSIFNLCKEYYKDNI